MKQLLLPLMGCLITVLSFGQTNEPIYNNQIYFDSSIDLTSDIDQRIIDDYKQLIQSYTGIDVQELESSTLQGINFLFANKNAPISTSDLEKITTKASSDFYIDGSNQNRVNIYVTNPLQVRRAIYYVLNEIGFEFLSPHTSDHNYWTYKPEEASKIRDEKLVSFEVSRMEYFATGGNGNPGIGQQSATFKNYRDRLNLSTNFSGPHTLGSYYRVHSAVIDSSETPQNYLNDYYADPADPQSGAGRRKNIAALEDDEALYLLIEWLESVFLRRSGGRLGTASIGLENRPEIEPNPSGTDINNSFLLPISAPDGGGIEPTESEIDADIGIENAITKHVYLANRVAEYLNTKYPDVFKKHWKVQYNVYGNGTGATTAINKDHFEQKGGIALQDNFNFGLYPYAFQRDYDSFEAMATDWQNRLPSIEEGGTYDYGVYDYWNITQWSAGLPRTNMLNALGKLEEWKEFNMNSVHIESTDFIYTAPFYWMASKLVQEEYKIFDVHTKNNIEISGDIVEHNGGIGRGVASSKLSLLDDGYVEFRITSELAGKAIKIGLLPEGMSHGRLTDSQIPYLIWIHPSINTYYTFGKTEGRNISNPQVGEKIRLARVTNENGEKEIHYIRINGEEETIVAKATGELAFEGPMEVIMTMSNGSKLEGIEIGIDPEETYEHSQPIEHLWRKYLDLAFGPAANEMYEAFDVMQNWSGISSLPFLLRELDQARNVEGLSEDEEKRICSYMVYSHYIELFYKAKAQHTVNSALALEDYAKKVNELSVLQTFPIWAYNYQNAKPYGYLRSPKNRFDGAAGYTLIDDKGTDNPLDDLYDYNVTEDDLIDGLKETIVDDFNDDLIEYPVRFERVDFSGNITNATISTEFPDVEYRLGTFIYNRNQTYSFFPTEEVNEFTFTYTPRKVGEVFTITDNDLLVNNPIVISHDDPNVIDQVQTVTIQLDSEREYTITWNALNAKNVFMPNDQINFFFESGTFLSGHVRNQWYMYVPEDAEEIILEWTYYDTDAGANQSAISFLNDNGEWIDVPNEEVEEITGAFIINVPENQRGKVCRIRVGNHGWSILNFDRVISKSYFNYNE